MKLADYRTVLAIGAHPDDVDMGCGGSLVLAAKHGASVYSATFSRCEDEMSAEEPAIREEEFLRAAAILGCKPRVFSIPDRQFPEYRREIMNLLDELQAQLSPELVFIPFLEDPHQDHSALANAAVRTFRRRETLLQYEILRYGSHTFTPSLFVSISDALDVKLRALRAYKSQLGRRAYFDEESFRSLARTRGAQGGYDYAEGFVIHKMYW